MKKRGFTLAEVLITLAIIGVIAALTLPNLMTNTTEAQIGPKLAKAVSSFEQANETLLNDSSVDTLSDARLLDNIGTYTDELSKHFKISYDGIGYRTKDGISYSFTLGSVNTSTNYVPAYKQHVGNVTIDINGTNKPNIDGTDRFHFSWWNDGSLRAQGALNWDGTAKSNLGGDTHWSNANNCPKDTTPTDATYCAGHIFENNLKVLYK